MNTQTVSSSIPGDIRAAALASYTDVAEDGTLCFVSDRVNRFCRLCGTVFAASAYRAALGRHPNACPFCRHPETIPLEASWTA